MRPKLTALLMALVVGAVLPSAQARRTLDIYVIDVEGGNATLFATPGGESVLIDAGNGGAAGARDAGRILEATRDAGITQIDHHITTHWHGDHFGALAELAQGIPIKAYYDYGPTIQPQPASTEFLDKVYPAQRPTVARSHLYYPFILPRRSSSPRMMASAISFLVLRRSRLWR